MFVWEEILWLRERVREQRSWIDRCGGTPAGYIARYGDPGVPPADSRGEPLTLTLTEGQQALVGDLTPVPGRPGTFYRPHSGDGGTAIYDADNNRLQVLRRKLSELEITCPAARLKADQMEGKVKARE